jgi:acetolactate synthase-1/2/3 large subunit
LRNPDFQAYARSFGVPAWRVTEAGGLRDALSQALTANTPTLIEVITDVAQEYVPWEWTYPAFVDG